MDTNTNPTTSVLCVSTLNHKHTHTSVIVVSHPTPNYTTVRHPNHTNTFTVSNTRLNQKHS